MIKAILFDLDGTLYDRDRLAATLFAEQYATFANDLATVSYERFLRDVHAMDEHGHGEKESGYRALVRAWGLDEALAERLIAHFWDSYLVHSRLDDDARDTLDELSGRGLKLGIITNGLSVRQRAKIAALGLERWFDLVLVSEEEGVRKPDVEIFRRGVNRCGVAAREAVFVGDHPIADVEGAHRAGLIAVWKFVPYWPPVVIAAPRINELSELLPLVS